MKLKIIRKLLYWLVHNGGKLPLQIVVNPIWAQAVRTYLVQLELDITVCADALVDCDDVQLVG
jgi:hypothetical protein